MGQERLDSSIEMIQSENGEKTGLKKELTNPQEMSGQIKKSNSHHSGVPEEKEED